MGHRAFVSGTILLAIGALAMTSCKRKPPQPGAPCTKEDEFECDGTNRLVCHDKKYSLETCSVCSKRKSFGGGGMATYVGCIGRGVGPAGAACSNESFDCDGTTYVKCPGASSTWQRFACRGPAGCARTPDGVNCDVSIAQAGEACFKEGNGACTEDHKGMLHCKGGVYVLDASCGGLGGCKVDGKDITCDTSVANVGDPCRTEGNASCSTDKQNLLVCEKGKFVVSGRCRGGGCRGMADNRLGCEKPGLGEIGDPCDTGGACQTDGKALLQCKNKALAFRMKCRTCAISGNQVTCKQ